MRLILAGILVGTITLGLSTVGTHAATTVKLTAVKLIDPKASSPEQTVNVMIEPTGMSIVDPIGNKPIKTFSYEGLEVTHTVASAPPGADIPFYTGKSPRNWISLKSASDQATLGVSEHVLTQLKTALGEHKVTITESK